MSSTSRPGLDPFLIGLVTVPVLATLLPARGLAAEILDVATVVAVCLLFFLHGAKLPPAEAVRSFSRWRFQLLVLGATFGLFPLLGLAARPLGDSLLTPALATGVMFLCLLPSTVQSSIAFTSMAKGNVALAVSSASLSNVVGVVLTPVLAALVLGSAVHITPGSVIGIVGQLLVPFVLGQLLHHRIGDWLSRHKRVVKSVDAGSVLLVVYGAFSTSVVEGLWQVVGPANLAALVGCSLVLLGVVLGTLTLVGKAVGLPRADRVALVFCGSKKSQISGVPMATLLFPAATLGTVLLPLMLFHLLQLLVCAVLARAWGRSAPA